MPLSPNTEMVVVVKGKPDATHDQIEAALAAWEKRGGHLDRLREIADARED